MLFDMFLTGIYIIAPNFTIAVWLLLLPAVFFSFRFGYPPGQKKILPIMVFIGLFFFLGISHFTLEHFTTTCGHNFNAGARADLKNVYTALEAYRTDHRRYTDSIRKLREYGLRLQTGVIAEIVFADETQLRLVSYHEKGDQGFIIETPELVVEKIAKPEAVAMVEKAKKEKWSIMKTFIPDLNNADSKVRARVAEEFIYFKHEGAVQPLIEALKDEDSNVRRNVVQALADYQEAVNPLIETLQKDEAIDVRKFAAISLGTIKDKRIIEPLIEAFNNDTEPIQEASARALLNRQDQFGEKAVDILIDILKCSNKDIRASAALRFGRLRGDYQRAVFPLIDALKDEERTVRYCASESLSKITITDKRAVLPLTGALKDESKDVRKHVARALGRIEDKRIVPPLITALRDHDSSVRCAASSSLGRSEDERAVEPLIDVMQDTDIQVKKTVIEALGRLKDRRAVEPLSKALNDEATIRRYAINALCNIAGNYEHLNNDSIAKALDDALNNEDEFVRKRAERYLKNRSKKRKHSTYLNNGEKNRWKV
jgi:HEAT repeat protein